MDPASGKPLQWAKHGSYRRLRLEEPRQPESELVVDDLRFHPSVAAGRLKLPCATTPAEDDAGRPAFIRRSSSTTTPRRRSPSWKQRARSPPPLANPVQALHAGRENTEGTRTPPRRLGDPVKGPDAVWPPAAPGLPQELFCGGLRQVGGVQAPAPSSWFRRRKGEGRGGGREEEEGRGGEGRG